MSKQLKETPAKSFNDCLIHYTTVLQLSFFQMYLVFFFYIVFLYENELYTSRSEACGVKKCKI